MQIDGRPAHPDAGPAGAPGLAAALTREHHDIDDGIEAFVSGIDRGEVRVESLSTAMLALRRHIYLEEAFVFPPIRAAGMIVPIMVMLREHGRLWHVMDALAELLTTADLDDPAAVEELLARCRELLALLDRHNSKEEPIIYPHAESDLTARQTAELTEFLRNGRTPQGWICQGAA